MHKPTILVTGKNGQLGTELTVLSSSYPQYNFLFTDRTELDITNNEMLQQYFKEHTINFCINAAAYTAVDKAETEREQSMSANGYAVGDLATVCKQYNTQLIHISTDYVFDGTAATPYTETHPTNPVNYYGTTKLTGEQLAQQNNQGTIIIRTSWVYSAFGNNFVKTMMRLMAERESINVVADQHGSPTYAADLAAAIFQIIEKLAHQKSSEGIYHYSNNGIISWFDFAVAIKELTGSKCVVNPIQTSAYPTPAKRPTYSGMNKKKIISTFNLEIPYWKDSLKKCVDLLKRPRF